ncbi:sensor histidine kinase [Butyrivibrio sp. AE3004]|uniref:sensor histidine kinase n=1 Tax=Butyrivibrio sp. AE3004 TaxID=1506994 RepID=UPI0004945EA5|nr:GHKL domain-containing protein [Butyrivibrio sp. AE3004]
MIYDIFRMIEFDGIVIFMFIILSLMRIYSDNMPVKKAVAYISVSMALYFILQYGTYALPFFSQPHHYWYNMVLLIGIPMITSAIFLKGYNIGKFLYTLFFVAFIQLYKVVWGALYSAENSMSRGQYEFFDILSFLLLIVLLYAFYINLRKSIPQVSSRIIRQVLLLTYFPISLLLYYAIDLLDIPAFDEYRDSIMALIILPALPILYSLFATTIYSYEEQRKLDRALTETKAQVHRYRYSLEIDERIKKERHELKNNYLYIQTLLNEKKYDELNKYLTDSIGEKLDNLSDISTGNTMIDYIINRKISEARKQHIKIYTEITLPASILVDDESFCTIFLNLFNNAMEACQKVESPDIHILLKVVQNYLCCEIKNKADLDEINSNPDLSTTKEDSENHGLGLKIVRETVESSDGIFQTLVEGNYFVGKFMLPVTI